jgi:GH35 family endo-1,4-beta-xylanase
VAGERLVENSADAQKYRDIIPKLFNKVVLENNLKWPFFESWGREGANYGLLHYLPEQGITMVRGHNLIWPDLGNLPDDVATLVRTGQKEALRQRIRNHFSEIMSYSRGKLTEWDVLNEPYTSKDVQGLLGDSEMVEGFKMAREFDPSVKLYLNDFSTVEAGGADFKHQDFTYDTAKMILDHGGPVDGIGFQAHFNSNLTPPTRVWEIYDRVAQLGVDLQVTEFDINVADEPTQAAYTRDFLTATFAHPAMKGFMLWGFWAGAHWLPRGAMIREDWTTKPNYDVWMQLVYKDWWTDVQGSTGADGVFRVRGFQGDYDIEISANGQPKTVPMTVAASSGNYVTQGKLTRGVIGAVVNAASFAGGPVAPGETVTIFGTGFGPAEIGYASYDADGQLGARVADTRVLFDGNPSPLVYSINGQVSAVVPYGVSGTTQVQVEYQGATS